MNRWEVTAGALGVGIAAAYLDRAPSGIPVAHVAAPGWYAQLRADIARKWPPATNASGAASTQLKTLRGQYGTMAVSSDDDVPLAPLGELAYWAGAWCALLDVMPDGGGGGSIGNIQFPGASSAAWTAAERFRSVRADLVVRAALRGADTVETDYAATYARELALLAVALDEVQDAFVPADDRGYWEFFHDRWDDAGGAVASAGGAVAGVVGEVTGSVLGGLLGTLGTWAVIGGVAYYVYRRWPG